jgi:hypothetical protein
MDSYQILKSIHKVGHPLKGKVIGYNEPTEHDGIPFGGQVILKTNSKYQTLLPFECLFDEEKDFNKQLLPQIGSEIETVVRNHVEDTLYVSARPKDLHPTTIKEYQQYYPFIEENQEGKIVEGIVTKSTPFGLFVDIGSQFMGLIDVGHSNFNRGEKLLDEQTNWPEEGDSIKCIIAYFRFDARQVGLGWNPDGTKSTK